MGDEGWEGMVAFPQPPGPLISPVDINPAEPSNDYPPRSKEWTAFRPRLQAISEGLPLSSADSTVDGIATGMLSQVELELRRFTARCAMACNFHWSHTRTCAKGGRRGDDFDCRVQKPCPPTSELAHSYFNSANGTFLIGRGCNSIVPYCPTLMRAWVRSRFIYCLCVICLSPWRHI